MSVSNIAIGVALVAWGATCAGCSQSYTERTPLPQSSRLQFQEPRPLVPGPFELGVWAEVENCLRTRADLRDIRLGTAAEIRDLTTRTYLWGVYAYVNWPDGSLPTVMIDRSVRYSSRVWSHEFVHVIAGVPDGDWRIDACTLPDGPYTLAVRHIPDEATP